MRRNPGLILLLIIILVVGYFYFTRLSPTTTNRYNPQPVATASTPIGQRTKTSGCMVSGALEDTACTPGAIIPTATKDQICVSGYSKSVRNVTTDEKHQVYEEYGIATHTHGQYEIDHLVSLELGGSNDIANLWPEAADPSPGFHQKDSLENTLHAEVCNATITLQQAQQEIATNWLSIYNGGQ